MSNIELQPGRALIKDKKEETIGGMVIASDTPGREAVVGEVIAMGAPEIRYTEDGKPYEVPALFAVGETVVYTKYHFTEFTHEGETYKIVEFKEIHAIIK